ncbi:hypothetical protein ACFQZ4_53230 [Catellatospora coxensis]
MQVQDHQARLESGADRDPAHAERLGHAGLVLGVVVAGLAGHDGDGEHVQAVAGVDADDARGVEGAVVPDRELARGHELRPQRLDLIQAELGELCAWTAQAPRAVVVTRVHPRTAQALDHLYSRTAEHHRSPPIAASRSS